MTVHQTVVDDRVSEVIDDYFARRIARAEALGPQAAALWRRAALSARGGKRLRPRLVMLTHSTLGGGDERSAAVVAAAFEVLHSALLLHDDVLDGDLIRRGRPNLAGEFAGDALEGGAGLDSATAWGSASGLLAGDLLLSGVHTLIAGLESPARAELNEIVDDALMLTAVGEHADVGFSLGVMPAGAVEIRHMMEHKTAAYSFAAPLRAGAVLARADRGTVEALGEIGARLGLLYQLRDDVLGVFGDEQTMGKSSMSDLREGKRTLLVAYAQDHPAWGEVAHLFGRRSLGPDDAAQLRSAIVTSGALVAVEALIAEQVNEVDAALVAAALPEALHRELSDVARMCAERDA